MEEWDEFEDFRLRAYSAGGAEGPLGYHPRRHGAFLRTRHKQLIHVEDSDDNDDDDDFDGCTKDIQLLERMSQLNMNDTACLRQPASYTDHLASNQNRSRDASPETRPYECPAVAINEDESNRLRELHPCMETTRSSPSGACSQHGLLMAQNHKRSSSCRNRPPRRPRDLDLSPEVGSRQRTYSMPTRSKYQLVRNKALLNVSREGVDQGYIQVRTFSTSSKGITSRGSSFKHKKELIDTNLTNALRAAESGEFRPRAWSGTSQGSSATSGASSLSPRHYRVILLGADGVGKSSIIRQFMTPDCTQGEPIGDGVDDNAIIPVLVDGQESVLEFVDFTPTNNPDDTPSGDAYVIVFSIAQRETFDDAVDMLFELRKQNVMQNQAVILVGNKRDIVRQRTVEKEEAKTMAIRYDVKYTEVSTILSHKMDDLLVGILKQIRLKEVNGEKLKRKVRGKCLPGTSHSHDSCLHLRSSRGIMGIILRRHPMFSSCDNLFVS